MKLNFKNINSCKLLDELIENKITVLLVENDCKEGEFIAQNTWITFADDVDMVKVDEVVTSHNPIPSSPQPTTEEKLISTQKELDVTNAQLIEAKLQLVDLGGTLTQFIDYIMSKDTAI